MRPIHSALGGKTFAESRPEGVVQAAICNVSGLLPTENCRHDPRGSRVYTEFFVAGTVPRNSCENHVRVEICDDTGGVATEFCPRKTGRTYITRLDMDRNQAWQSAGDRVHMVPQLGTCTVHTSNANIRPTITLNGSATITLNLNEEYKEQGATASDERDGNLTSQITISGSVDTTKEGTYVLTYTVRNTSGNEASVSRTVNVRNNTSVSRKPTIVLNGTANVEIYVGDPYNEMGATAKSSEGSDITSSIVITGSVNTGTARNIYNNIYNYTFRRNSVSIKKSSSQRTSNRRGLISII
jgi:hypothetical protein